MRFRLVPAFAFVLAAASAPMLAGEASAQPAQGAAAAQPSVNDVVSGVQNFYNSTSTFKADFQQKFHVKAYNQEKSSKGHVTFSKPGKMDWVYDDPKDNRVVSDGANLKVYEAANKQMFEQTVDKSQYPAALSFLTGQGNLGQSFNFTLATADQMKQMGFAGGQVLIGEPKQPSPAYTKVLFYVDGATFQVRRVMIIDGQGNRNRFEFANPRVNETVSPSQFTFTPPPGTQIVRP